MAEALAAKRFIFSRLDGDATITAAVNHRIYADEADQGAVFPYIIIQAQSPGQDTAFVNGIRVMTKAIYVVKVVGQTKAQADLEAIQDRIYALLHRTSGTGVWACTRTGLFELSETYQGRPHKHLGGVYEMLLG